MGISRIGGDYGVDEQRHIAWRQIDLPKNENDRIAAVEQALKSAGPDAYVKGDSTMEGEFQGALSTVGENYFYAGNLIIYNRELTRLFVGDPNSTPTNETEDPLDRLEDSDTFRQLDMTGTIQDKTEVINRNTRSGDQIKYMLLGIAQNGAFDRIEDGYIYMENGNRHSLLLLRDFQVKNKVKKVEDSTPRISENTQKQDEEARAAAADAATKKQGDHDRLMGQSSGKVKSTRSMRRVRVERVLPEQLISAVNALDASPEVAALRNDPRLEILRSGHRWRISEISHTLAIEVGLAKPGTGKLPGVKTKKAARKRESERKLAIAHAHTAAARQRRNKSATQAEAPSSKEKVSSKAKSNEAPTPVGFVHVNDKGGLKSFFASYVKGQLVTVMHENGTLSAYELVEINDRAELQLRGSDGEVFKMNSPWCKLIGVTKNDPSKLNKPPAAERPQPKTVDRGHQGYLGSSRVGRAPESTNGVIKLNDYEAVRSFLSRHRVGDEVQVKFANDGVMTLKLTFISGKCFEAENGSTYIHQGTHNVVGFVNDNATQKRSTGRSVY